MLTYEKLPCGFVVLNHAGMIMYANSFMNTLLQRPKDDMQGQHIEAFLSPTNKLMFHSCFYPQLHTEGSVQEFMLYINRRDGVQIPMMINAHHVETENGAGQIECIFMPMSKRISYEQELRKMTKELERVTAQQAEAFEQLKKINEEIECKQQELILQTNTDRLTNIFNRRFIEERLVEQLIEAQKNGRVFSLCIIDIDFFKKVNDTYGHQIGDYVLVEVASLLKACVGERGTVARYGGEEFLVLLPEATKKEAIRIASEINESIRRFSFEYVKHITVSIGVATYRQGDVEANLLNRADRALYYSKETGRDRTTHFRDIEHVLHP